MSVTETTQTIDLSIEEASALLRLACRRYYEVEVMHGTKNNHDKDCEGGLDRAEALLNRLRLFAYPDDPSKDLSSFIWVRYEREDWLAGLSEDERNEINEWIASSSKKSVEEDTQASVVAG